MHRALALDPKDRFPSARDMAQELAGVLGSAPLPTDAQELLARLVREVRKWGPEGDGGEISSEIIELSFSDVDV